MLSFNNLKLFSKVPIEDENIRYHAEKGVDIPKLFKEKRPKLGSNNSKDGKDTYIDGSLKSELHGTIQKVFVLNQHEPNLRSRNI